MKLSSSKQTLLAGAIATACAVAPIAATAASDNSQPNVLIIVMDDLGTAQLDFTLDTIDKELLGQRIISERYNGDMDKLIDAAKRSMPNVTKMAADGVKMTNAFVAHPVCGPSRAGIFTGRAPANFGIYSNTDSLDGVPLDVTLLPELFQDNGYYTANVGKWHNAKKAKKNSIAEESRTRDYHDNEIVVAAPGYAPDERGFDYSYSYYASGAALWNTPAIWRNGVNVPSPGYLTHNLTDETLTAIKASGDKPFFINLAYSVPHIPLEEYSPAKYMDKFNTGNIEVDKYFAAVNAADEGVGKILALLKQRGELDNTMVFFLSDNGAVHESPMPQNGMDRGHKGRLFNGGVRVPFIVRWPQAIPAGGYSDSLISAMDIIPTALTAANIQIPASLQVEGQDILPLLSGNTSESPHQYLYWAGPDAKHYSDENTQFWKDYRQWITFETNDKANNPNLERLSKSSWAIRDQEWALYFVDDGSHELQLFNDKLDPMESKNLAAQHPKRVKEMKAAFYEWIKAKPKPVVWGQDQYQILTESAKP
ncbi:MAG: sulfatase-like hydrolase/transferase [Moritella sp.]|uniref:sulfatase family protein n=1 Tax=Moritella sp. TaxID=78556 RepID=UPI0029A69FDA|nr:sulfatase-like hydrolase/transferase [Moritella sp.]MDX2321671.1 sulfatase-like hydrolase/transferase [Moritella sp.]